MPQVFERKGNWESLTNQVLRDESCFTRPVRNSLQEAWRYCVTVLLTQHSPGETDPLGMGQITAFFRVTVLGGRCAGRSD